MQNINEEHRRIELEDESVMEISIIQGLLDLQGEELEYYSDQTIRNLLSVTSYRNYNVWIYNLLKSCLVRLKIAYK